MRMKLSELAYWYDAFVELAERREKGTNGPTEGQPR